MAEKQILRTKIALIGCGPANTATAIQLIRSGFKPIVICQSSKNTIRNANLIENLIGFPGGISGEEFNCSMILQLANNNATILEELVSQVSKEENNYIIETTENSIHTEFLIIGSGTKPLTLDVEGEKKAYNNKKLFYEVYNAKDLAENKDIVIIGSGDAAYDYALNLSTIAKEITIIQRTKNRSKSLVLLQERVMNDEKIAVISGRRVKNFFFNEKKDNIQLRLLFNDALETIKTDLILVAIGRKSNIDFLSPELLQEFNCLANTVDTNIKNSKIYFIGDVKNGLYRQITIAAGEGVRVAMEIARRINSANK